jgi:hypothetical protein
MWIENIHWLSKAADEAEVIISDGLFRCEAYSQPCTAEIGDTLLQPLHVFGIKNAMRAESGDFGFRKLRSDGLAQRIVAKVANFRYGRLAVGNIELIADDPLPGGIQDGDLIELECARVDMW